mgnify:CR=1 FL=1
MDCPRKIDGRNIISISQKGCYVKKGNEYISYIAIVYNKYVPAYISYDLNSKYQVLCSLVWDEDTLEECKTGIQITYSNTIEWTVVNGGMDND